MVKKLRMRKIGKKRKIDQKIARVREAIFEIRRDPEAMRQVKEELLAN